MHQYNEGAPRLKTRAALMATPGADWTVESIDLDGPRAGEVLVRFTHAGLCFSDEHLRHGSLSDLPVVGGHEGAGIVEEVGAGVTRLSAGDHVAASFIPACGRCPWCARGRSNLCDTAANGPGMADPATFRFSRDHEPLPGNCGLGTFAEYAVVSQDSLVEVDPDIPLNVVAVVSCGVLTGWGAAVHTGAISAGDTVVVVGGGGVGVNAIQGARSIGAQTVVLADPNPAKEPIARTFGADEVFSSVESAAEYVQRINPTANGADAVIVATGDTSTEIVSASFAATGKAGTLVLAGMSSDVEAINVQLPGTQLVFGEQRIQGTIYGSCSPVVEIPRILSLYRRGRIKLDELISQTYALDSINTGFEDLRRGKNLRGIIEHARAS